MTASLKIDEIRTLAMSAWRSCGGGEAMGRSLVDASIAANLGGRPALGLAHFVDYLDALVCGRLNGHAEPWIEHVLPAAIRCDAGSGTAQYAFELAFDLLVAAAQTCGIALFTIRNCYTAGEMAHYVRLLAERGLIGLVCSNAHAMMAAAPGGESVFGTNPLAFAVPRPAPHPPLVFDQATSATAFLNVARAVKENRQIPQGWATGPDGKITTDPQQAVLGALLPFGGSKGANIALMVEVLAAGLSGGKWSMDAGHFREGNQAPDVGMTVIALSPSIADPAMVARLDAQLDRLAKAGVHIPGARAPRSMPESLDIDPDLLASLQAFLVRK